MRSCRYRKTHSALNIKRIQLYLVHIHALISPYNINTYRCTHVIKSLHPKVNCKTGDSFCWTTQLSCITYSPWRWPFKSWNMLELHIVLIKWWFNNIWVHLLVFIWCKGDSVCMRHRWKNFGYCQIINVLMTCPTWLAVSLVIKLTACPV